MTAEPAGRHWERGCADAVTSRAIDRGWEAHLKRGVDVVGALVLLVLLAPIIVVAVLAVRVSSPGAVVFRQERVGRDGRPFVLLKLRTMRAGCGDDAHRAYVRDMFSGGIQPVGGLYKLARDARLTPVGGFLRRTSLDELPQLWNVLRGEMSLVGPRPPLAWEVDLFPAWAMRRFEVRPGLSGLWQVSGRNRLTMAEGLALDVRYVEQRTLRLDLVIMARTIRAVVMTGAR